MASSIGFHVCPVLPVHISPKRTAPQTALKVSSIISTQNKAGSSSIVVPRRSGNYKPNTWDHSFIQSLKNEYAGDIYISRAENLKEDVRKLFDTTIDPLERLELIDTLQHLGIAYHFNEEIRESLLSMSNNKDDVLLKRDIHATSLFFMILRGHGFEISQEVFQCFKGTTGEYMDNNCGDIKGMLSLYEASYLGFRGEKMLDEARAFTTNYLKKYLKQGEIIKPTLKEQVVHSLELPRHWRVRRFESYWYIDIYERQGDVNPALLELAKLDFNLVQSTHHTNIQNMSRWWMNLGIAEQLTYTRDRVVESFFGTFGGLYQPQFSSFREGLTKVHCMTSTIDDTYDIYGSMEELVLLTDAVNRWELSAQQNLPEYLKVLISALFITVEEICQEILNKKGVDISSYLKKGWADLCNSFLLEAKWYHSGYTPTLDEYLNNAWISATIPIILIHTYFYIIEEITDEALDGLVNYNGIIRWSSIIVRFTNDLATFEIELEKGDTANAIPCYMLEKGVTEDVAVEHIRGLINEAWRKINKECVDQSLFPREFIDACINTSRMSHCLYQHGDGYSSPDKHETTNLILFSLIKPIPLA
ncbi:hypothetical protein QJS10_CPB21g01594 [Acorus calamus]|uniref:Uncharacterized protein n=1 Tax=Acorus calamus TaxID=4465 RepID=A0AAV9C859_ACOCL|nr:hypothetical protein QJS10_CPB21g01594 [Acorus calamus]